MMRTASFRASVATAGERFAATTDVYMKRVSGLTQRDLADRLDTDQKYIWALESGKKTIVLERIFEIMRETGVRMYMEIDSSADEPPVPDRAQVPRR